MLQLSLAPEAKALGREPIIIGISALTLALTGFLVHGALSEDPTERKTANFDFSRRDPETKLLRKLEDLSPDSPAHRFFGDTSGAELDARLATLEKGEPTGFAGRGLAELRDDRARREKARLWDPAFSVGSSYSQSPDRLNPLTQFYVNPLLNHREGMFLRDGGNVWAGPRLRGEALSAFSYEVEPLAVASSHGSADSRVFFRRAYGKFTYRNLELKAGVGPVQIGMGHYSNMAFSENPEPFPMVRLANTVPGTLPGFLGALGPARFQLFAAKLEAAREFPHAWIEGLQMSFLPTPRLETSLYFHYLFGGDGSDSNFLSPLGKDLSESKSSRSFGLNFRYRIPGIELEPYVEIHAEDCCGPNYVAWNTRDVLGLCGLYFPRLDNDGRWDLALEWGRTNYITYRHSSYTSGYKYRKNGLGHGIGSDGDGVYAVLRYFATPSQTGQLTLAYEVRRPNVATSPSEYRYRVESQVTEALTPYLRLSTEFGLEKAQDFDFIPGNGLTNYFAGVSLTAH